MATKKIIALYNSDMLTSTCGTATKLCKNSGRNRPAICKSRETMGRMR